MKWYIIYLMTVYFNYEHIYFYIATTYFNINPSLIGHMYADIKCCLFTTVDISNPIPQEL